ncbi:GDSL esterase/lipase At4g10955-like [Triticum dicoccoides]|uniref:GDSL esterase/lipase At4g10955-like n=1 Tax=Triticum dicoccoides TaxID=85692 RepID=UPI00188E8C46|nr:GDSL esterase/lipase At4g10955-like [Triticum dicoccoides]
MYMLTGTRDREEHRRCIAACLVKGTYVLENDRTLCRIEPKALAPAWWKSFHFDLVSVLTDRSFMHSRDQFIFGAIYKHVAPPPRHPSSPRYIIAFRGTMPLHPKAVHDFCLDFKVIFNTLPDSKRCKRARLGVESLLATIPGVPADSDVWLTGHSLGASVALDVGRAMMLDSKQGRNLPTFLFNPPQVSLAPVINKLLLSPLSEPVKTKLQDANNLIKAGLGLVLSPHRRHMEEIFHKLSRWVPSLYVHDKDIVCQGFIDHFEQRRQLEKCFHGLAGSAVKLSYRDMLYSFVRSKEKELPHLLPSATLWRNSSMDKDVNWLHRRFHAHELQQWWKADAELGLSPSSYSL